MMLAFYIAKRGTLWDRLVGWWTALPGEMIAFSHVELVLELNTPCAEGAAPYALCVSSSPRDRGVRCKRIDIHNGKWVLVNYPAAQADAAKSQLFMELQLGKPYDWLGILGFIDKRVDTWDTGHHRWFCSEFCAAFLQRQDLLRGYDPLHLSPQQLYVAVLRALSGR
jgi:endogenous inhibitor of DNA gyrase (YacG/DUF329 family)